MSEPYDNAQLRELVQLVELGRCLRDRDEIIRRANYHGISRNNMFRITGLARTTIDRILDGEGDDVASDALPDDLAPAAAGQGTPDGP